MKPYGRPWGLYTSLNPNDELSSCVLFDSRVGSYSDEVDRKWGFTPKGLLEGVSPSHQPTSWDSLEWQEPAGGIWGNEGALGVHKTGGVRGGDLKPPVTTLSAELWSV